MRANGVCRTVQTRLSYDDEGYLKSSLIPPGLYSGTGKLEAYLVIRTGLSS